MWLGEVTVRTDMTIAVDWDIKHQTKQTNKTKNYESHWRMKCRSQDVFEEYTKVNAMQAGP